VLGLCVCGVCVWGACVWGISLQITSQVQGGPRYVTEKQVGGYKGINR